MCGLAGIAAFGGFGDVAETRRALQAMTRAIAHRGPDAEGFWLDEAPGVALGHRRLSILDLSPCGAQPMHSACGRYVIVFNGEIYNHQALRSDLAEQGAGLVWKGHSDTETLLAAISGWGLQRALESARGMFAFALWDRRERVLSLGRDRMGEKPLYFARQGDQWRFGSELRALLAGGLEARIDPSALASYLRLGYVPDHSCILEGVRKVVPGSVVHLRAGAAPETRFFATIKAQFAQTADIGDAGEAVSRLETVLGEVVRDQMLSDVPLGCFLSGGVDSSLVASIMQSESARKIRTFSIGFEDARFNEAQHAAAVAGHLGTDHTEFILKEEDALAIVADLPKIYDEPFADSSQIPTTLLCRSARQHVTVALSGDGGDEIFGGYNRHIRGPRLWERITRLPPGVRRAGAHLVDGAARFGMRREALSRRATRALGLPLTTLDNLPKLAATLRSAGDAEEFYQAFVSTGQSLENTLLDPARRDAENPRAIDPAGLSMVEWIMARDTTGYLPGDILVKVDRAAMSVGLETRAPFLDARVADIARRIPVGLHVDGRRGKKLLREVLYRHVPKALIERPKQGFAMPLDDWLRGALRSWGEELISDEALIGTLRLDAAAVSKLWERHQERRVNAGKDLWTLLMLLLWARHTGIVKPAEAGRQAAA